MIGRTNVGGSGGGAKVFAVISVTYSEGNVCTCTDGTKTLKLKDTSGQGFFLIPYAGTWIVTATDGTNTKSESVEITSEGQSVSVELSYWDGTLFKNGEQYTDITGGWSHNDSAIVGYGIGLKGSLTSDAMKITCSGDSGACFWHTVNKIDLTEFSQLVVTFKSITQTTYRNVMITAKQEIDTADNFTTNFILAEPITNIVYISQWTGSTPYTATFSLDGFNGYYYIGWGVAMSINYRGSGTVEVDEVLLR